MNRSEAAETMKRKASAAFQNAEDDASSEHRHAPLPCLDDCFIAAEILRRLPAHVARAFSFTNAFFRGVLTDPNFWLASPRRTPTPHAACLVVRGSAAESGLLVHEFHYADADGFTAEPAVAHAAGRSPSAYLHAGTCNGLVLLAAPWSDRNIAAGVLLNPASGEEAVIAADMPGGGRRGRVFHRFCGLGYSPSSKAYKALLCVRNFDRCAVELMVLPLGGTAARDGRRRREPRKVAKERRRRLEADPNPNPTSLSLDGKVYVVYYMWAAAEMMAFDVDDERVTFIDMSPAGRPASSELMEVWGRPCVATADIGGGATTTLLWTLTPEHRWELRCSFAHICSTSTRWGGDMVHGAWDCGDGFLFVMFLSGRGYMYDLRDGAAAVACVSDDGSDAHNDRLQVELRNATFCWGYQPTLIPPVTVLGDVACTEDERGGLGHFSSGHIGTSKSATVMRDRCLESLMEMMRKRTQREEELAASGKNI